MKTLGLTIYPATEQKPVLVCMCCNIWTARTQVHKSKLIGIDKTFKKSKTWKRLVHTSTVRKEKKLNKTIKAKEVFFSYDLLECIGKKHKFKKLTKAFKVPSGIKVLTW